MQKSRSGSLRACRDDVFLCFTMFLSGSWHKGHVKGCTKPAPMLRTAQAEPAGLLPSVDISVSPKVSLSSDSMQLQDST